MNQVKQAVDKDQVPERKVPAHDGRVDRLSAGAFMTYLALFLLGTLAHSFFPFNLGTHIPLIVGIGFVLVIAGPALIFWAQSSIRKFHVTATEEAIMNFAIGPYRYMRNPTYFGLTLLVAGFGFFANASSIVLSSLLSYLVVRFAILKKEELMLLQKYGEAYARYTERVKRWF